MAIKSRRIGEQVESNNLGRIRVTNNTGGAIAKGDLLSVTGTNASGGFLQVGIAKADAGDVLQYGMKLVAAHNIAAGATGIAVSWLIADLNTDALAGPPVAGDRLYLSAAGTSEATVAAAASAGPGDYQWAVGQVLIAGGDGVGKVLLCPIRAAGQGTLLP